MSKTVLIAEDEPGYADLFEAAFRAAGYEVHVVNDGKQALSFLKQRTVDLLVSDVMMPHIDGYHLARAVSELFIEKAPKIILMTSRETQRERGVALLAGASAFLQKPVDIDTLLAEAARLVAQD